jgi:hypothetical protein
MALTYFEFLLLSDSGRQLLTASKLLESALPLLQQEAEFKAAEAVKAAAASAAGGNSSADATGLVVVAVRAALLHARAAVHQLGGSLEEQPAALAHGGSWHL